MRKIYTDKEILRALVENALQDGQVSDDKLIGMQSIGKASRQWTFVCRNVGIKKWPCNYNSISLIKCPDKYKK
jgi:hypothetical protein